MTIYTQSSEQLDYLAFTYHLIWTKELTGLEHDTHYYGSKHGSGAHPDILWIGYYTSSEYVADFRKQYGDPNVIKIKKKFHGLPHCKETADIVTEYESRVLNRMNAAARPDYLNKSNGGGKYHTAFGAVNTTTGAVPTAEFWKNRQQYTHIVEGTVSVLGGRIAKDEYTANRHLYTHVTDGKVNVIGGQVTQEEFRKNRHLYETATKGTVPVLGGRVTKEEYESNKEKYKTGTSGTVNCLDTLTGISGAVSRDEYWSNKKRYKKLGGNGGLMKGKKRAWTKDGKICYVDQEDIRLKSGELTLRQPKIP